MGSTLAFTCKILAVPILSSNVTALVVAPAVVVEGDKPSPSAATVVSLKAALGPPV